MSANGGTNQRIGFHRWVASLKRETQPPSAGVSGAPPSAASATSNAPPAPLQVASAYPSAHPPRVRNEDDATRVHHIPKEIIHRMRARAGSESPAPPNDERTRVFRAPPELLERAKRAQAAAAAAAPEELATPLDAVEASLEHGFGETLEARSGISLRPQERPQLATSAEPLDSADEPLDSVDDPLDSVGEPLEGVDEPLGGVDELLDDAPGDSGIALSSSYRQEHHASQLASVSQAPLELSAAMTADDLEETPSFRPGVSNKVWFAVLMVVVAVVLVWTTR